MGGGSNPPTPPVDLPVGATPPHTLEKHGGGAGSPGPDAYELLKTPHRLVRSQYCGIVWVKEEGSWRDLEICVSPKVGGGGDLLPPPLPGKWGGGERPLAPLFLRLWSRNVRSEPAFSDMCIHVAKVTLYK